MFSDLRSKWNGMPIEAKASVSYAVCSIFQRCLNLITVPLFSRLLTTEQYGQFTVYLSWGSILTIFTTLNLAYGSFSTAMIKFEDDRKGYIAAVHNVCLLLNLAFLVIYFPFQEQWNRLFNLPTPLVCLMVAEIFAQFVITCWYSARKFDMKYRQVIFMTALISLITPVITYVFVINSHERGYARIAGSAVFPLVLGAVWFVQSLIAGKGGLNQKYWKYAFSFNIPLLPYFLSQVVFSQSDRIMIDHIYGTDKAGLYNMAHTLAMMLQFVLDAINSSYVPWLFVKIKENRGAENKRIATGISMLMAFLLLGVIAVAPEIILIMGGKAYYEAVWAVPPVAMSILLLFYSQLFIHVEIYFEEKTLLVLGSILVAVLNIVLNAMLIPVWGFVAAAYTTLISYAVFAISNYYAMRHVCKKHGFSCGYFNLRDLLIVLGCFLGLGFLAMALYDLPIIRYCIIAGVLIAVLVFHKQAILFVKSVVMRE